jgi:DNA-binding NarL/FixJ family response regulator
MPLRCVIVDDSPDFLAAAREMLEDDGLRVVGTAATGDEALRAARELRPDVTLVDVDLGGESGFAVARRLRAADVPEHGNLVLISSHAEDELVELIEASPALGFVPKADLGAEAIAAVLDAHAGGEPAPSV